MNMQILNKFEFITNIRVFHKLGFYFSEIRFSTLKMHLIF